MAAREAGWSPRGSSPPPPPPAGAGPRSHRRGSCRDRASANPLLWFLLAGPVLVPDSSPEGLLRLRPLRAPRRSSKFTASILSQRGGGFAREFRTRERLRDDRVQGEMRELLGAVEKHKESIELYGRSKIEGSDAYEVWQTMEELEVVIPVPTHVVKSDIEANFRIDRFRVRVQGRTHIDTKLQYQIDPEECGWVLEAGSETQESKNLKIHIFKKRKILWSFLGKSMCSDSFEQSSTKPDVVSFPYSMGKGMIEERSSKDQEISNGHQIRSSTGTDLGTTDNPHTPMKFKVGDLVEVMGTRGKVLALNPAKRMVRVDLGEEGDVNLKEARITRIPSRTKSQDIPKTQRIWNSQSILETFEQQSRMVHVNDSDKIQKSKLHRLLEETTQNVPLLRQELRAPEKFIRQKEIPFAHNLSFLDDEKRTTPNKHGMFSKLPEPSPKIHKRFYSDDEDVVQKLPPPPPLKSSESEGSVEHHQIRNSNYSNVGPLAPPPPSGLGSLSLASCSDVEEIDLTNQFGWSTLDDIFNASHPQNQKESRLSEEMRNAGKRLARELCS